VLILLPIRVFIDLLSQPEPLNFDTIDYGLGIVKTLVTLQ
jgi:hypothetical protein